MCIILGSEAIQNYSLSLLFFNMELKVRNDATRKEKEIYIYTHTHKGLEEKRFEHLER